MTGAPHGQHSADREPERLVVRDKRRLDPDSGELRVQPPAAAQDASGPVAPPETAAAGQVDPAAARADPAADKVAELTADLQRVSAEYANYRKRVERDRATVVEIATAGLLAELLPLLDDVARARSHGDLDGAFKGVGEGVERVAGKLGLEQFGAPGDAFDPAVHEALMAAEPDPAATVPTCAQVLQPGYRLASGRVLRPARVAVAEPAGAAPPAGSQDQPAQARAEDAPAQDAPGGDREPEGPAAQPAEPDRPEAATAEA